jgi:predicted metal-dependent hydrolase
MQQLTRIKYDNIGVVVFVSSRRSKYLRISVGVGKPVRVSFPQGVSLDKARNFFESKMERVCQMVAGVSRKEAEIEKIYKDTPKINVEADTKRIYERLCSLAADYGYKFNKVAFRNQTKRWASCSHNDNISLNISLAMLPQHLCDYVLLHELAHTKVKNHSADFWQEMARTTEGKAKLLRKELTKYPLKVYQK